MIPENEHTEDLRLVIGMPRSCIWVGDISATVRIPLLRVASTFPVRPTSIAVQVGTSLAKHTSANHWAFAVEKAQAYSTVYTRIATPFRTSSEVIRAGVWKDLMSSAEMTRGQTLSLRIEKVGTPAANLVGVAIAFSVEVR